MNDACVGVRAHVCVCVCVCVCVIERDKKKQQTIESMRKYVEESLCACGYVWYILYLRSTWNTHPPPKPTDSLLPPFLAPRARSHYSSKSPSFSSFPFISIFSNSLPSTPFRPPRPPQRIAIRLLCHFPRPSALRCVGAAQVAHAAGPRSPCPALQTGGDKTAAPIAVAFAIFAEHAPLGGNCREDASRRLVVRQGGMTETSTQLAAAERSVNQPDEVTYLQYQPSTAENPHVLSMDGSAQEWRNRSDPGLWPSTNGAILANSPFSGR